MVSLIDIQSGAVAKIEDVKGGHRLRGRLGVFGVRVGREIKKVSAQPFNGPLVVEVDRAQIAMGRGMAAKIFVEVLRP